MTTVLAGNCGFSVAPTLPADRRFFAGLFAKVEGMAPAALDGISWEFETFPEFLDSRTGRLGVNLACYVGHCNLRRWVMGPEGSARAATPAEVVEMGRLLAEAMEAGAAGFSSTHASTHNDGDNHPVPSRFAEPDELLALADELGRAHRGTITYLPRSAVGGLDAPDMDLLIELGRVSRLPVIIQGLGGRNKVDAPGAGWDVALEFLERARSAGSAVYSLLLARPFDRPFTLEAGTTLYEGVPAWDRVVAPGVHDRRALLEDPAVRDAMRYAVEAPNRDPDARIDPAAAPLGRAVRGIRLGAGARRLRRSLDRRHRRRAGQSARRRHARPGDGRRPRHPVPLGDRDPGVDGGGPRSPAQPPHDHRHRPTAVPTCRGTTDPTTAPTSCGVGYSISASGPSSRGSASSPRCRPPSSGSATVAWSRSVTSPTSWSSTPRRSGAPGARTSSTTCPVTPPASRPTRTAVHATIVNGVPVVLDGKLTDALPGLVVSPV